MKAIMEKNLVFGMKTPRNDANDDCTDADTADLLEDADAVLATTTPSSNPLDLSAYLIRGGDRRQSMTNATPVSLDSQDNSANDEESREASSLLDYLDGLAIESPLTRTFDEPSSAPDPIGCDMTSPVKFARNLPTQTPMQCKSLANRTNHLPTWPAGIESVSERMTPMQRSIVRRSITWNDENNLSPTFTAHLKEPSTAAPVGHSETESSGVDDWELKLDQSLEELLEHYTEAMLSPPKQTLFEVSEEEWQRLEQVQEMAQLALREAKHERETARIWARNIRESVWKWVEEQRTLEEARVNANQKSEVQAMRDALERLQCDTEEAACRNEKVKQKLQVVIQQQADKIHVLEEKLKAVKKSSRMQTPHTSAEHGTPSSRRISLSPEKKAKRRDKEAQSPLAVMDAITPTKHDSLPDSIPSPVSISVTPRTEWARTSLTKGGKLIVYRNGTEKETRPDGTCVIRFPNGDVKCTLAIEAIVAYYHSKERTTHIRHRNGVEIFEYPNQQIERHFPNGRKDVRFADGTRKIVFVNGTKETQFPDGVCIREDTTGKKEISGAGQDK